MTGHRRDQLTDPERHCLMALLYFDVFDYPLTAEEVRQFATGKLPEDTLAILEGLVASGLAFQEAGLFSVRPPEALAVRRRQGNALAEIRMKDARKYGKLIACFPFVRGVLVSGSLSKQYMEQDSDVDFFVVTRPGRLWIVRTALAVFRRVFLFNSHRNFCTNYFIAEDNLHLKEHNMFSAVEFSTLIPIAGSVAAVQLAQHNIWYRDFLPNRVLPQPAVLTSAPWIRTLSEFLLRPWGLDRLDGWLMNRAIRYWQRRYGSLLNQQDFRIAFDSTRSVSRAHPGFFQQRVLDQWKVRITGFEVRHQLILVP
ncbi:MAG: hypothetical protein K1X47_08090 [Cyclobacteriaceae bacterium]|nr:hypothetical protein [Cyclobacteriaceae bacterium]